MSTQFMRHIEVTSGGRLISNKDYQIEFRLDFDDDPTPNTGEITIYNLSATTLSIFKKNANIVVNAGYKSDSGVIFVGYVTKVITRHDGTDHPTVISVIDSQQLDAKKTANKAYKKGVRASAILSDLLSILKVASVMKLPVDKEYKKGYSVNGNIVDAMKAIAKDCGALFYISKSNFYIRSITEGEDFNFTLSPDTGLIGSPEPFEEETEDNKGRKGYKVKSLLQFRMGTASIITLKSKWANGRYRVRKGSHICQGNSYYTEVEVE